jgi:hypothetical protein
VLIGRLAWLEFGCDALARQAGMRIESYNNLVIFGYKNTTLLLFSDSAQWVRE